MIDVFKSRNMYKTLTIVQKMPNSNRKIRVVIHKSKIPWEVFWEVRKNL